jgi:hypothetical protein
MKNLLYKEIRLVVSPSVYLLALLSGLLLIPSYPYFVGISYCLIGVFITFKEAAEHKDHEFTALLPVSRNHIVLAKHISVMYIEMLQIVAAIPFAFISSLIINPSGNKVGMDANIAFFGFAFTAFSVFNLFFLPSYFKTGYKTGMPMLFGLVGYLVTIALLEGMVIIVPWLKQNIDGLLPATVFYQVVILAAGLLLYLGGFYLTYRLSIKNFNKVNL